MRPVAEDCLEVSPVLPRVLAQGAETPPGCLVLPNFRCELLVAERSELLDPEKTKIIELAATSNRWHLTPDHSLLQPSPGRRWAY